MRVLVTGATGFIGSHLTRLLVSRGCTVHCLIRDGSDTWRIADVLPEVHVVRGDLMAVNLLEDQLESIRPEICFHLAWYATPGKYLESEKNLDMLTASINLASGLARLGCRKLVATGTCFEYDTDVGYLAENSATKPLNLYAASKLSTYLVLKQLADLMKMDFAWIRLFYQYGPYEDERRLVPSVIRSLLLGQETKTTMGRQIRDFLHVEDVASAIWAVGQSDLTGPVNVGSGKPVAVRDIVAKIGEILNAQDLIRFGALPHRDSDPMFICANNRRLIENTAWVPAYDLEDGLRCGVEWWRVHLGN